jgi:hypothetical protein
VNFWLKCRNFGWGADSIQNILYVSTMWSLIMSSGIVLLASTNNVGQNNSRGKATGCGGNKGKSPNKIMQCP